MEARRSEGQGQHGFVLDINQPKLLKAVHRCVKSVHPVQVGYLIAKKRPADDHWAQVKDGPGRLVQLVNNALS